jgi:phosphoribosylanthranilate isomerase
MIKVKTCGITNIDDALMCSYLGADALGFIFSKKSPRYISEQAAKKIITNLDPFIIKVGVFLDEEKGKVLDMATSLNLDILQFHGKEGPAYCSFFKPKFGVIKVFFPQDRPFKRSISRYKVDGYLFDIKLEEKAEGKKVLPKDALKELAALIKEGVRVIISGGLTPNNVSSVKKLSPYAVDVASGIEKFIGKKDKNLVSQFIKKVKT